MRVINEWARMGDGGLDLLEDEIKKYDDLRLVVIDTLQMNFSPSILSWSVIGAAEEVKTTNKQQLLYDAIKNADGPVSPKELIKETGLSENYVHKNMSKLVDSGDVKRLDRGKYQFVEKESEES